MDLRVKILQALADETRFWMVIKIKKRGEIGCSELSKEFHLSKPALSHHFRILREAGLIKVRRDGQYHYFTLDNEYLEETLPGLIDIICSNLG